MLRYYEGSHVELCLAFSDPYKIVIEYARVWTH